MLIFGISYSCVLYTAATVKFLNVLHMNAWRDTTFILYVISITWMSLTSRRGIEKDLIRVAICYLTIIFILRIIGNFIPMPEIQYQLIFINGITFALCLMVIISAYRHGHFKND